MENPGYNNDLAILSLAQEVLGNEENIESPWQPLGKPWDNKVSAVRLTVFTGAGSRASLKPVRFLGIIGKPCENEAFANWIQLASN